MYSYIAVFIDRKRLFVGGAAAGSFELLGLKMIVGTVAFKYIICGYLLRKCLIWDDSCIICCGLENDFVSNRCIL